MSQKYSIDCEKRRSSFLSNKFVYVMYFKSTDNRHYVYFYSYSAAAPSGFIAGSKNKPQNLWLASRRRLCRAGQVREAWLRTHTQTYSLCKTHDMTSPNSYSLWLTPLCWALLPLILLSAKSVSAERVLIRSRWAGSALSGAAVLLCYCEHQ